VDIPEELVEAIKRGNAVLFVGAGLSMGAGLPGWKALIEPLADRIHLPPGRRADLLQAAQDYENACGRQALIGYVCEQTDTTRIRPTDNHRRLVQLGIQTWITTNYDDLLEQTLRETGQRYSKVVREQDLPYTSADRVNLIKMHGDREQRDTIILTRRDYDTYFQRYGRVKDKLNALLAEKTFLFVGYSAGDPDFAQLHAAIAYDLEEHQKRAYAIMFDVDPYSLADLKSRHIDVLNLQTEGQGRHSALLGELLDALIREVHGVPGQAQPQVPTERPELKIPLAPYLFISYSHHDQAYVRALENDLRQHGFGVWIDERIDYGERWFRTVVQALRASAACLVVMTPQAEQSEWVEREVQLALQEKKPIFPLLLDGRGLPILITVQHADVRDGSMPPQGFYERLAQAVHGREEAVPPLPARETGTKRQREELATPSRPSREKPAERRRTEAGPLRRFLSALPVPSWGIAGGLGIIVLIALVLILPQLFRSCSASLSSTPTPAWKATRVPSRTAVPTSLPSNTPRATATTQPTPEPTPTTEVVEKAVTATPTPTPPKPGSTQIREKDGAVMVYVPAGEFWMGSDHGFDFEGPRHKAQVDAFWIDRTEVTNAQYRRCVDAKVCSSPRSSSSKTRESYYDNAEFNDYPVVYVTWDQAREYAQWVGGRLPTEAEWEYAARGTDGRDFPWGNEPPDERRCNFDGNVGDITPVGQYSPQGDSPYGCADMAGNVWEWTSSLWGKERGKPDYGYPYDPDDGREDESASADVLRVVRGGSFIDGAAILRCSIRNGGYPDDGTYDAGFRVVAAPDPTPGAGSSGP
jgi:formylglycine-generating enzyme required for sulfatase activity